MLTFEKIRDLERAEREAKKLQELPENLMEELKYYLRKKESIKEKTSSDILELENVKNIIRRLFELRENKILDLALYTSRTGLQPENLTQSEERIFNRLVDELKKFREDFFSQLRKPVTEKKKILYRVKKDLPKFIGPDLKHYELKENDIVELSEPLNDLLLKKDIVEKVES